MNRAIVQRAFGGEPLDVLELVEKEKPKASAGHVVVKLTARSIIPYDFVCIRQADLECFRDQQPVTGIDGCGIVDEVGEGVTKYKKGDRVIPILLWKYLYGKGQGSWQDYIEVAEDDIIPCPETIPDEIAAQLLMTECALYGSFMDLEIPQGEWFLQTAANSNFGRQIIQLAKHRGIKTINIVRRDNVIEALKALGADEVINFTKEDVISKVKEITGGKGVYAAHDAVAGTLSKSVAACVRDGGTLFMVGELSGTDFMLNTMDLHRHLAIDYWDIATVFLADRRDKVIAEVVKLLKQNVITPLIRKKYHLISFKEALKEAEMSGKSGRILLVG